jgi:hypothetical protein
MRIDTLKEALGWLAERPVVVWLLAFFCIMGGASTPYEPLGDVGLVVGFVLIMLAIAVRRKRRSRD